MAWRNERDKKKTDKADEGKKAQGRPPLPKVIAPEVDAPRIKTPSGSFDLDDPVLPDWIEATRSSRAAIPTTSR